MTSDQLQELKAIELDLLKQFLNVCEKLNLTYYVLGGTLLGAVRHKGFIPWDDDIDVGMPREDYEVFLSKGQEYLPGHCFLQTFRTDPEFPANFAKIRHSGTTFIESSLSRCDINHGVYIDVFPLDYYPEKHAWLLEGKKKVYTMRISMAFSKTKLKLKTHIARLVSCIICPSYKAALVKREELFKTEKPSSLIVNHCGAWGKKEIVPACWYEQGVEFSFEGLCVKGPKEYDKWLTQVYGDYMQLPPVEKRQGHHYTNVVDLKKPYTEYKNKGYL